MKLVNIKKIDELDVKIKSGTLTAFSGQNNTGKTTAMTALINTFKGETGKDDITHGEKMAMKDVLYKNKNGDSYRVTVNYAEGKKPVITMIYPDLSKSKKITDLRSVFNYNNVWTNS